MDENSHNAESRKLNEQIKLRQQQFKPKREEFKIKKMMTEKLTSMIEPGKE